MTTTFAPPRAVYVALGSSMAAGPGIRPVANRAAGRSKRNYPAQVAERLDFDLIDATVSGATIATVLTEPQRVLSATFAPQIQSVTANASLVTITIGGNDVRYVGRMIRGSAVAWATSPARLLPRRVPGLGSVLTHVDHVSSQAIADEEFVPVTEGLTEIVERVRSIAANTRILLVDYLTFVGDDAKPSLTLPLTTTQLDEIRASAENLRASYREAARRTGAELIAASAASAGHGVGSPEPWVTGFSFGTPWRGGSVPFHPTLAGMTAVADLIVDHLNT